MNKSAKEFIKKMLILGSELELCDDKFQMNVIINDAEKFYERHMEIIEQQTATSDRERLDIAVSRYVMLFSRKHDIEFDSWVGNRVGTVALFDDYFIDFDNIRYDLETEAPKAKFFEWYDFALERKATNETNVNYYSYLKGFRGKDGE